MTVEQKKKEPGEILIDARERLAKVREILSERGENKIMLEKIKVSLESII